MKKAACVLSFALIVASSTIALALDFKPYPGAKIDAKASQQATQIAKEAGITGSKATIYTVSDSFEKVYAFYQKSAKEYKMPGEEGVKKLPSGQELKEAYFIFDGAADIMSSKLWIKIQRPYIGSVEMGKDFQVTYKDVRDITAITVSEHR
ncbi:MAG: hypothetical protein OHK0032_01850 [Thermodesulfovibrionales bacterium]